MTRATHIRKVCPIFSSIKIFCKVLWKLMEAPKQTRRGTFVVGLFLVSFFSPELKGPNFVKVKCNSPVVLNFYYCHFFFFPQDLDLCEFFFPRRTCGVEK